MKKKLSLQEIKVSSFVTEIESVDQKSLKGKGRETLFSCLDYISCNPLDCIGIELQP
ncbi:MAG: pinensin family lanthipeptide [Luteibaculum sp.]